MKTKLYVHRGKEDNYLKATELGLSDKATETFAYALYEVGLGVDINENTGEAMVFL